MTSRLVTDVIQAISGLVLITARECPAQPAWIGGGMGEGEALRKEAPCWPAVEVLPARNALVHLPSFADGKDAATPPSPRFFNAFAS